MTEIKDQHISQWPPRDEQLFQMLMSAVKDYALILLDKSGAVMSWNDGAELIKGYAASEIIGQNFSNFYLPQERADGKPERILKLASKYGKYVEEGWRLKKDGTIFFAKVVISAFKNDSNELVGFAKVTSDITTIKKNEQLLHENEERFRLFMAAVKDYSIIMLDTLGNVVNWNEGAHRIIGYSYDEIVGRNFSVFYSPEDIAARKPELELQSAALTGRFEDEGWRIRKDGSRFYANVIVCPLLDSDNSLRGFAKITRDVTEQRETEKRIKEFYSVISHELRSPMTSIRGALGLLEGGLAGDLSEDAKEITSNARLCCDRLIRLINDLLDLSTLNAGLFKLQKSVVATSILVDDAVASLQTLGRANELHFRVEVNPSSFIFADPDRIVQVLTNLISNAIKFSPSKAEIKIDVESQQTQTKFVITDQGPGIPSSAKSQIFERFQQLDSSDSRHHEGSGLGLAISKAIVEQHGGTIDFSSEPGVGTTFWFTIPNTNEVNNL